jgi:hypothetical protein
MDIKNQIKDSIDAALIFTQTIRTGFVSMGGRNYGIDFVNQMIQHDLEDNTRILSKYESPEDYKRIISEYKKRSDYYTDHAHYEVTGDPQKIRGKLIEEYIDFTRDVFSEEMISHLLESIFEYNHTTDDYELIDDEKDYMINVASMMAQRSIVELEKYLDPKYAKFLCRDLERAIEICNMISNSKDKVLFDKRPYHT